MNKKELKSLIVEISKRDYSKMVESQPKQKVQNAYKVLVGKLNEIDKVIGYSLKLREDLGDNWILSEKQLDDLRHRTMKISRKLKQISK